MSDKFLILSLFVSILLTKSYGDSPTRGARNYNEDLPEVRAPPTNRPKLTTTLDNNEDQTPLSATLDLKPPKPISVNFKSNEPWEPLACSRCLSDRYLVHYVERGCKQINSQYSCRKPCPKYFQCPKRVNTTALKGCDYNGKVYKFKENVPVTNPCKQACYCDPNINEKNISHPTIRCAHVDCPFNFRAPDPNCFMVFEEGKCCPTEKCLTPEQSKAEKKCLYRGDTYKLGQRIYPKEDPCLECVCDKNWNQTKPELNKSCKKIECDLQSSDKFRAGCLPIYHEQSCCPIEYFCPPQEEHTCKFNGKKYLIGEKIDIGLENTECKCMVPPDFTCIKKSVTITPLKGTDEHIKKFQTLPTINITNSSNNPFKDIPELDKGFGQCPPFIPEGLKCAGYNCTTIIDDHGCQACKCDAPCDLVKCRKGCRLEATTPGVCPECNCN